MLIYHEFYFNSVNTKFIVVTALQRLYCWFMLLGSEALCVSLCRVCVWACV